MLAVLGADAVKWLCSTEVLKPGAIIAVAAILLFVRLGTPPWTNSHAPTPRYLFDESYTAFSAHRLVLRDCTIFSPSARRISYLVNGETDLAPNSRGEWSHPPGSAVLFAVPTALFGFSPESLRSLAAVAGILTLLLLAWWSKGRRSDIACVLLATDGGFFVFSRTAMPYLLLTALVTLAAVLAVNAVIQQSRTSLLLSGLCFGLAVSIRWSAAPIAIFVAFGSIIAARGVTTHKIAAVALAAAAMLIGYALPFLCVVNCEGSLANIVSLHVKMLWFHLHMPAMTRVTEPAYMWPWATHTCVLGISREREGTWLVLFERWRPLWWLLVPATGFGLWRLRRERDPVTVMAVAVTCGTFLPWFVIPRYGFAYYLLPALPAGALLSADLLSSLRWKWISWSVVAYAVCLFAICYPVHTAVILDSTSFATYSRFLGLPQPANP